MKVLITLCFFLFSFETMAQLSIALNGDSTKYIEKPVPTTIRIRCRATNSLSKEPLLVIDGVPWKFEKLREIEPQNIESVTVLNENNAAAIYGCRAAKGVIIITTKSAKRRRFRIRDFLDGSNLAGATVSFISIGEKKDTLMFTSNDSGLVTTDKLDAEAEYKMTISFAGYKTLSVMYKNTKVSVNSFSLERDIISFAPVIVTAFKSIRRCWTIYCWINGIPISNFVATKNIIDNSMPVKIYPNPVQPGHSLTIEINSNQNGLLSCNVIAVDGRRLLSQVQETFKGMNRFSLNIDNRWTAGVYFVQVLDEKRSVIKLEKIVIL